MNERDKELAVQCELMRKYNYAYSKELQEFVSLIRADEREKVLAEERIRIGTRLDTLKTAIALLKAENTELKTRENK